jgi:elongation factor Ts
LSKLGLSEKKLEIRTFQIRRCFLWSYIHSGNKIATLVALSKNIEGAEEVARNVSMQAAAMSPIALDESGVDAATIEKKLKSQKIFCVKKVSQKQC